jgi:hypothetical protein
VAEIDVIGKSPDKKAIHQSLVHRDIGDPVDEWFVHFKIAKCKNPDQWGPSVSPSGLRKEP